MTQNQAVDGVPVDPFAFRPGAVSRIEGLGGDLPSQDPFYVFHTAYHEAAPGPSRFTVRFHGLAARRGTLVLRAHMLPLEPGARAVLANSDRLQLNRLIELKNGQVEIAFEGFRHMSYALYACILDDTDATARDVEVWLDRPADPNDISTHHLQGRNTQFGSTTRQLSHMISTAPAGFRAPATQVATEAQCREQDYRALADAFGSDGIRAEDWKDRFVVQALKRYGLLQADASGAGLVREPRGAEAVIRSAGCQLEMRTIEPPQHGSGGGWPGVERGVHDFLWSIDAWLPSTSPSDALHALESLVATVRPGGLMVHCGPYRLGGATGGGGLSRADVERFLLVLISRGHEVAEFRIGEEGALVDAHGHGAVGLIFRRARTLT